jgi:hypothetical protein
VARQLPDLLAIRDAPQEHISAACAREQLAIRREANGRSAANPGRRRATGPGASLLLVVSVGQQRARLEKRLDKLKQLFAWDELSDGEYQSQRDETRRLLAELPDGDRITSFDAYRANVLALPEAIAAASPGRRAELCRLVVDRVVVRDRSVHAITWTAAARPFFEKRQRACPQGDSNP